MKLRHNSLFVTGCYFVILGYSLTQTQYIGAYPILNLDYMKRVSLSQTRLSDSEYTDGELHPLLAGSLLRSCLMEETWLNCGPETQNFFQNLLRNPHYFSGTILSQVRQQVELTVITYDTNGTSPGAIFVICVTLADFSRFTST